MISSSSVLSWNYESVISSQGLSADSAKMQELRDHTQMSKLIEGMGRSAHFNIKIVSIAIKLIINVSVGILFYLLNIGLFNTLSGKMELYAKVSGATSSLMQTANLNLEKLLWTQNKLNLTEFESSAASSLNSRIQLNDGIISGLLETVQTSIADSTALLEKIGLSEPALLWGSNPTVELTRVRSSSQLLTFKDTISTLLSDSLTHYNRPAEYFSPVSAELRVYLENSREPLRLGAHRFLDAIHQSHSDFSTSRRNLLLLLLCLKIGVGVIFVTVALYLYAKEMGIKEDVVCLFYSFMPSDVRKMLGRLENSLTSVNSTGFYDSDFGFEQERESAVFGEQATTDDLEDETSVQILMVKRAKTRGKLANSVDLNKSFTVFFALINTAYFVFVYFWNISNYMQFWSLARLSRNLSDMSVNLHSMEGLLNAQLESGYSDRNSSYLKNTTLRLQELRSSRFEGLSELIGNKFGSISSFDSLLDLFFQDSCVHFSNQTTRTQCAAALSGTFTKVGVE